MQSFQLDPYFQSTLSFFYSGLKLKACLYTYVYVAWEEELPQTGGFRGTQWGTPMLR